MRILICAFVLFAIASAAILGLDYGQMYTKAVLLAPGISFEIVATNEGKRKDLSGISIKQLNEGEIERVYGSSAGSLCTRFPQSCAIGVKTLLGKSIDDQVTKRYLQDHCAVKLIGDVSRSDSIKFDFGLGNETYNFGVEEITAMSINEIKRRALKELQLHALAMPVLEDLVISIPPFASQSQRQAYLDSTKLANFSNTLGLVEEGTAVALNYVTNKKFDNSELTGKKEYQLVYDMGASSTKATLFSLTPFSNGTIVLEIESIGYDEFYGGQLLTNSIYDILLEKLLISLGIRDPTKLPSKVTARLMEAAERAKIILSVNSDYHVLLENIYSDQDFKCAIKREEFEESNSDLIDRITNPILDAIKHSKGISSIDEISSVILNGGSTRVPFVQKHLMSLLGEKKLSKNVNADESCALGTTQMGLKWKTQLEKTNDIRLVDKSFSSFEIKVNMEEIEQVVFEKGAIVGHTKQINLGNFVDNLEIKLLENGRLFKTYEINDISERASKLQCHSKESMNLIAYFHLDHNKMFDLKELKIECVPKASSKGGFLKNLLHKDTEDIDLTTVEVPNEAIEPSDETTEAISANETMTSTKSEVPIAPKVVSISLPRSKFAHMKPMSRTTIEKILGKLSYLDSKDNLRATIDHVKNLVEAKCYEVKSYINENEEKLLEEFSDASLSELATFALDTVEWVEFDCDESTLEDFEVKLAELDDRKKDLETVVNMADADLSFESMEKVYEEGSKVAMQIQDYMLQSGSQISEVRKKFEDEGFDFDKENDRMKMQYLKRDGDRVMKLDRNLASYKDDITKVGEVIASENHYNKLAKKQLYDLHHRVSEKIGQMLADIALIQDSHNKRLETLNEKFKKLVDRKAKKQLRDKLKLEKESEAAKSMTTDSNISYAVSEEIDLNTDTSQNTDTSRNTDTSLNTDTSQNTDTSRNNDTSQNTSQETNTEVIHDEL